MRIFAALVAVVVAFADLAHAQEGNPFPGALGGGGGISVGGSGSGGGGTTVYLGGHGTHFNQPNFVALEPTAGTNTVSIDYASAVQCFNSTAVLATIDTSSFINSIRRWRCERALTSGALSIMVNPLPSFAFNAYLGTGQPTGVGGAYFHQEFTMGWSIAIPRLKCLVGWSRNQINGTGAGTQPSDELNFFGVGFDSTETVWSVMHNDGVGLATKVPLGANFPNTNSGTDWYILEMYWSQNATEVELSFTNATTNNTFDTVISTDLPAGNLDGGVGFYCSNDTDITGGNLYWEIGPYYGELPNYATEPP